VQELQVPKTLHGPVINDGWFSRGAAWNATEDVIVYVAEARAAEQTPAFGSNGKAGSSSGSDSSNSSSSKAAAAAPRTWRGVAAAVEDWGELNTGGAGGGTASYELHLTVSAYMKYDNLTIIFSHATPSLTLTPPKNPYLDPHIVCAGKAGVGAG
jgi:acylaminoacyl-peptidase